MCTPETMAIAIPFPGQDTRQEERRLPDVLVKAKQWLKAREKTGKPRPSHADITIAVYLGVVLGSRVNRGLMNKEDARAKLDELIRLGVNSDQICTTYFYMEHNRACFYWSDIGFQLETLQRYWSELIPESIRQNPEEYFDRTGTPENSL